VKHAFHLFPVLVDFAALGKTRSQMMNELRARGIGTQVHYIPVCNQPYYREQFGLQPGLCPHAERFYSQELSLPMFPAMTDEDVCRISETIREFLTNLA
jgi:dTDP-4-amino-4,6-dideoxygalactose transaminase